MYISSMNMEAFGHFFNVRVTGLGPGLTIFYGDNESGKSTILEFIRWMLFGLNAKSIPRYKFSGTRDLQGSIQLNFPEKEGRLSRILLKRTSKGKDSLTVYSGSNEQESPQMFQEAMLGLERDEYFNVFGFSLGELERFESLIGTKGVKDALYAASFGTDLKSPLDAAKYFKDQKLGLLRPSSREGEINASFGRLNAFREQIIKNKEENHAYNEICDQIKRLAELVEKNKLSIGQLKSSFSLCNKKLNAFDVWDEWRKKSAILKNLPEVAPGFPQNALSQLERLESIENEKEMGIAELSNKSQNLERRIEENEPDSAILEYEGLLTSLLGRKSSYQDALDKIGVVKQKKSTLEDTLRRSLFQLGSGWDCERIRQTDRSLFKKDGMKKLADELSRALMKKEKTKNELESNNQELNSLKQQEKQKIEELAQIPMPDMTVSAAERDKLLQNSVQLEDIKKQFSMRQERFEAAKSNFMRVFSRLGLEIPEQDEATPENGSYQIENLGLLLDKVGEHQTEAEKLADKCGECKKQKEELERSQKDAEKNIDALETQVDAYQRNLFKSDSMDNLEERASALRHLRTLNASLATENQRKTELEERIQSTRQNITDKNIYLMVGGVIFLAICTFLLTLAHIYHLSEITLFNEITIPVAKWEGYLFLILGSIMLCSGWPRKNRQRKQELIQLEGKRENTALALSDLARKIQQACQIAQIESAEEAVIDRLDKKLEKDKFLILSSKRDEEEIFRLKTRLDTEKGYCQKIKNQVQDKASELQKKLYEWHMFMEDLGVGRVPVPEAARIFYEHLENAKQAFAPLANIKEEIETIGKNLKAIETAISSVPAVQQQMEAENSFSLPEAVKLVLENCRQMDDVQKKREEIETTIRTIAAQYSRKEEIHTALLTSYADVQQKFDEINAEWETGLDNTGLERDLTFERLLEAYNIMENCLGIESDINALELEIEDCEKKILGMEEPLRMLYDKIGAGILENQEMRGEDWLIILDELVRKYAEEKDRDKICKTLAASIEETKTDMDSKRAALEEVREKINRLLEQGKSPSRDDFRRQAVIFEEKSSLESRLAELAAYLENMAGSLDQTEFLASLENEDKDSLADRLETLKGEISQLEADNEKLIGEKSGLEFRARNIANDDKLSILLQKEKAEQEKVALGIKQWLILTMGERLLEKATKIYEKERQPEVIKDASGKFRTITNNAWQGLSVSMDKKDGHVLSVINPEHKAVSPEYLSRGAQEQAYLCLRLAHIASFAKYNHSLPVIMDEILVNFDPTRAERTARVIADMANGKTVSNQQVFYFTCQPFMVDILQSASPFSAIYNVNGKKIEKREGK